MTGTWKSSKLSSEVVLKRGTDILDDCINGITINVYPLLDYTHATSADDQDQLVYSCSLFIVRIVRYSTSTYLRIDSKMMDDFFQIE
jgi:hypothetical protein